MLINDCWLPGFYITDAALTLGNAILFPLLLSVEIWEGGVEQLEREE